MAKAFEVKMDTSRINATMAALHSIVGGDFKDVVRPRLKNPREGCHEYADRTSN
jgi:hypothetical protein